MIRPKSLRNRTLSKSLMFRSIIRKYKKVRFHLQIGRYKRKDITNLPTHIQIEPTVRCNLNCAACTRKQVIQSYKKLDLSLEEIDQILSYLPNLKSIKLQGLGEPLLHPNISEVLQKFKQNGIKIWTISNGTLFLQEKYRNLVLNYISDIAVSFDSVDKEKFKELRGGADMNKVLEGIRLLIKDRDQKKLDTAIGLNLVVSDQNYLELCRLGDLAIDLNVDYVTMGNIENWMIPGEFGYECSISFVKKARQYSKEIDRGISKLRFKLLKKGILFGYKNREKRLGKCAWPFNSMLITVEGLVTPCCIRMHSAHSFGNIFENKSIAEIWNSKIYRGFRKSHMAKDNSNLMCRDCPD